MDPDFFFGAGFTLFLLLVGMAIHATTNKEDK